MAALKAEPHVVAAALYDGDGKVFAVYPATLPAATIPRLESRPGYALERSRLVGRQAVIEGGRRMGTLVLESDLGALYERLKLYAALAASIVAVTGVLVYFISRILQQQISRPILALAETATAVSQRHDYSVRAPESDGLELTQLTHAFNHMLQQVQEQHANVQAHLSRMHLLQHITRAIGERQDLRSIFQVVLQSLQQDLSRGLLLHVSL